MTYRKIPFVTGEYYHVYNRTVGDAQIFNTDFVNQVFELINYCRFKHSTGYSHFKRLPPDLQNERMMQISLYQNAEILSFSLMSNHFHFLLRQMAPGGISTFISNFQNSLAKYINTKNQRKGALFCEMFKAKHISTTELLIHVARYIELNPVTSSIIDINELDTYPLTSFSTYMENYKHEFITKKVLMDIFQTKENYRKFVYNQSDYQRKLKEIKDLI